MAGGTSPAREAKRRDGGRIGTREERKGAMHESFLRHRDFFWLKLAGGLALVALFGFALIPAAPGPYGGTWFGYVLGTIGAGLIVWLAMLGVRKRRMTPGRWSLKGWTSAHVWLGLALIVVATLHTGMRLGWNLATLAWTLMMLVIGSGVYGISVYATLPSAVNRTRGDKEGDGETQAEMLEGLRAIDRQLLEAAQPLPGIEAEWVLTATAQSPFSAGLRERLTGSVRNCATSAAMDALRTPPAGADAAVAAATERVGRLLRKRRAVLDRIRASMRTRALLEVWLYIHVPITVALLAALAAHIVSVFYYW